MSSEPGVSKDPAATTSSGVALILIDFINAMDFPGAEPLRVSADRAVDTVIHLRERADALGIPVIYVNDNFGHWRKESSHIVADCVEADSPARHTVRRIAPRPHDYFVVKPHLSGFYATSLPVLLPKLGVNHLVLTGVAADICVLFTAADAHMRDYALWVPSDAVASEDPKRTDWALDIMRKSMSAETRASADLSLDRWVAEARARRGAPDPARSDD